MNPGGIRAVADASPTRPVARRPAQVTYGEAFTVQPFNNLVVTQTFTGASSKTCWSSSSSGSAGRPAQRILQPSAGFTYSYDSTRAAGDKISEPGAQRHADRPGGHATG